QMIAIKSERAKFVAVVLASDGENRKRYFFELLPRRHHGLVIGVHHWVVNNPLKIHRWISNKTVEGFERDVLAVSLQKFTTPKFCIRKQVFLTGVAAGQREPLHIVGNTNVVGRSKIETGMGTRHRR